MNREVLNKKLQMEGPKEEYVGQYILEWINRWQADLSVIQLKL